MVSHTAAAMCDKATCHHSPLAEREREERETEGERERERERETEK